MASARVFDIVLFGATGFTGGLVANYLVNAREPLRWALAGRSREKLERVRAGLTGRHVEPELITVDASDRGALLEMVERTRVVITTVGPYITYGEPLLAACAELGTDYVDLTGEPEFLQLSLDKYHELAAANGARIVHACGFDSIPHDLGALFTVKALRRRMTVGEQDTLPVTLQGIVQGNGSFSGGTWHSIVTALARVGKVRAPEPPRAWGGRKLAWLPPRIRYRRELGLWQVPLPSIDPLIVLRSASAMEEYGREFRYGHNVGLRWFVQLVGLAVGFMGVLGLAQWHPTRSWLLKIKAPGQGPDEATRAKGWFKVLFEAQAGEHRVTAAVGGGDPGYGETAVMIAESALCLAFDRERLPNRFGVVTSASAMGERLIERLQRAGISFEEH